MGHVFSGALTLLLRTDGGGGPGAGARQRGPTRPAAPAVEEVHGLHGVPSHHGAAGHQFGAMARNAFCMCPGSRTLLQGLQPG